MPLRTRGREVIGVCSVICVKEKVTGNARLDAEEDVLEETQQWIKEDAEDYPSPSEEYEEEANRPDAIVDLERSIGQIVAEDAAAVERWDGDEVEDEQQQVDEDDVVKQQRDGEQRWQIFSRDAGNF